MNNEEQLIGINLERVTFCGKLAVDIRSFRSPQGSLKKFFPEITRNEISNGEVLKVLTSFYAGVQYSFDNLPGKKDIPRIYIGDHTVKGKKIFFPGFAPGYGILLPKDYVLYFSRLPSDHMHDMTTKAGKYIGQLPKLAMVGETGAEEMTHAIQHQQNRLENQDYDVEPVTKP